ncbi:hypothetical protein CAURIC_09565 [Corynebacterium auriscanis]|nr:hypothetical protein CAURIC_09565 [Corynebacterium auriscanis]
MGDGEVLGLGWGTGRRRDWDGGRQGVGIKKKTGAVTGREVTLFMSRTEKRMCCSSLIARREMNVQQESDRAPRDECAAGVRSRAER